MSTATRSDLQVGDLAVWYKGGTRHESRVRATDSEGISTAQGRVPWSEPTLTRADDATVVEHAGVMPRGITPGVLSLPLGEVRPSPLNPREETDVEALAADLQAHGQINPITVRETGEEPPYEVITGERRLQAAAQAGLTEILAVSRGALSAEEAYRETIRENAQRRDLGPLEEARAVHQMQGWDWGQEEIGKLLGGRSQSWVSRTAALLSLPGPVQAALSASRLSRSQAEELLALGRWPSNQESLAVECEAQGWTAADLAVAVKRRKEYLEAKERPAAPAVVPGDPESERAARERNLAVAIASPPPVEQPAVTPAPPPAAKPGALKSAEEIARERQAARTGEPAPPAPITAIIPGPLRQRFEALGGFAIPALTLWCELAELATEHEITPQLAVRLLGRFLAYCTGLALRPETVISELEENLRKLEAEDSDG